MGIECKNNQLIEKTVDDFFTDLILMIRRNAKKIASGTIQLQDFIKDNLGDLEWKHDFQCIESTESSWYNLAFILNFYGEKQFLPINFTTSQMEKFSTKTLPDEGLGVFMPPVGGEMIRPQKEFYLVVFDTNNLDDNQSYYTSLHKLAQAQLILKDSQVAYKINDSVMISSKNYEDQKNHLLKASIGALFESEEFFNALLDGVQFAGAKKTNHQLVTKFKESWDKFKNEDSDSVRPVKQKING